MFTFKKVLPVLKHDKAGQEILDRLDSFLTQESPELVYWFERLFEEQQNAVTYAELREAVLNGYEQYIWKWQEDYAVFVNEHLAPEWRVALRAGAASLQKRFGEFILDDSSKQIKEWMRQHTAEFITNIGEETRAAINAILAHGQDAGWSAQQMAYAIRPCIGLTRRDALANARYRQHVLDTLLKQNPNMIQEVAERKAHEAALRYASMQHRQRAEMIANTELAHAYNRGNYEGVRQAMAQGLMGACEKVWLTAGTERVCSQCMSLNGRRIGFEDPFNIAGRELYRGAHQVPPAHPRCRCVVQYVEYTPPARSSVTHRAPDAYVDDKMIASVTPEQFTPEAGKLIREYIKPENMVLDYSANVPIAYRSEIGKFALNPDHPNLKFYNKETMLIHEIFHCIDGEYGLSVSLAPSINAAVIDSRAIILADKEHYAALLDGAAGTEMCISDIFSAITLNEIHGDYGHSPDYWAQLGNTEFELVANLLTIRTAEILASQKLISGVSPLQKLYQEVVRRYGEITAARIT